MSKQSITNLCKYNLWANQKIVDWLRPMDQSVIDKEVQSSFSSIHATIQHIHKAQIYWISFLSEIKRQINWAMEDQLVTESNNQLLSSSNKLVALAEEYEEESLHEILTIKNKWINKDMRRYEYIQHVVNHGTYHRGQIITMARSLGITDNIPATEFLFFLPNNTS